MKRITLGYLCFILLVGCANAPQDESTTCKKIRRQMAYIKHSGGLTTDPQYFQLQEVYREYDCA